MPQTIIPPCKPFARILALPRRAEIPLLAAMTARDVTLEISRPIEALDVAVRDAAGVVLPVCFDMLAFLFVVGSAFVMKSELSALTTRGTDRPFFESNVHTCICGSARILWSTADSVVRCGVSSFS